jgi:hypothetical protein
MKKNKILLVGLILALFSVSAFAGTGGSEVASWYIDISAALKGGWGKIIATVFIAIAFMAFKGGEIVIGIFMGFLGLSIGSIPDIIDSKYTAMATLNQEYLISSHTLSGNIFSIFGAY